VIETERLLLRRPVADDAAAILEAIADPEVMRYIGTGETGTFEDAATAVETMLRAWELDGSGRFVAVRKDDDAVLGRVGLLAWDPTSWRTGTRSELGDTAELELGSTLSRAGWGRGYATEVGTAVRGWAEEIVRPGRLISLIHADNAASKQLAAKIGERYRRDATTARGVRVQLWST
jgi:RimJ/RimL family protein N-acetyltransferase